MKKISIRLHATLEERQYPKYQTRSNVTSIDPNELEWDTCVCVLLTSLSTDFYDARFILTQAPRISINPDEMVRTNLMIKTWRR